MRATRENIMKRLLLLFLLCFGLAFPCFAADGASFDPTTVAVKSTGGIPVGTVITWPSNSWPSDADKWLECNGQSISSAVYPELVVIVDSHVSDYRGILLRGHGFPEYTLRHSDTFRRRAWSVSEGWDSMETAWGGFWFIGSTGVQKGSRYGQGLYSFDVACVSPVVGEVRR